MAVHQQQVRAKVAGRPAAIRLIANGKKGNSGGRISSPSNNKPTSKFTTSNIVAPQTDSSETWSLAAIPGVLLIILLDLDKHDIPSIIHLATLEIILY